MVEARGIGRHGMAEEEHSLLPLGAQGSLAGGEWTELTAVQESDWHCQKRTEHDSTGSNMKEHEGRVPLAVNY